MDIAKVNAGQTKIGFSFHESFINYNYKRIKEEVSAKKTWILIFALLSFTVKRFSALQNLLNKWNFFTSYYSEMHIFLWC